MAIKLYRQKLREFDDYLRQRGGHRGKVQTIVEWYQYLTRQFDTAKWRFPFSRHVKAAKNILTWADDDIERAEGLVFDFWHHYHRRNLNWNLDTAYRNIPSYEGDRPKIPHEHDVIDPNSTEGWDLGAIRTRKRMQWQNEDGQDLERLKKLMDEAMDEFLAEDEKKNQKPQEKPDENKTNL